MSAVPVPEFSTAGPNPPCPAVEARGSSYLPSSSPRAVSHPGDVTKPSDPFDTRGWLEWLSQSPAGEMADRVTTCEKEASVRMLLMFSGLMFGPVVRRDRLDAESAARVKADDEARQAAGLPFWAR